jgi:PKD repeat protein
LLLLVAGASATQFTISNIQVNAAGGTATTNLVMDTAPATGISGYIINLTVANPSIAEVSAVTYNPALGGLTDTTTRPFSTGHIGWVDVNEVLQSPGGETDLRLATITIKGLSAGSTTLKTTMTMISSDTGADMIPSSTINNPTITVGGQAISTATPLPLQNSASRPADPDGDGLYEDLNGDGAITFSDVTLYFNNWHWIEKNEPVGLFDYNQNGAIDFGDILILNQET